MELHPITKQYLLGALFLLEVVLGDDWTAGVAAMAVGQVTLGISALLSYVPTWLGSAHQAGALILMSLVLGTPLF